jgi:SAM-dependent methyltransferase
VNLIDLIKRKDRAIVDLSSDVSLSAHVCENVKMRTVELPPASYIRIENVHEFEAIKSFPVTLGWKWSGINKGTLALMLEIILVNERFGFQHKLFSTEVREDQSWHDIVLAWPPTAGMTGNFSMVISCRPAIPKSNHGTLSNPTFRLDLDPLTKSKESWNGSRTIIGVSRAFNSRRYIPELIKGTGIEVGPGLNPQILPSDEIQVRYIEALAGDQWVKLYQKADKPQVGASEKWDEYILSSAATLDEFDDGSLDFIFSNHVFEHLMNPIGVLEKWSRKLQPSGLVYNVIPDAHSCFDLRQSLSNPTEWILEHQEDKWEPDLGKYERYCAYTAPYKTAQALLENRYSIHVHYYSPESAAKLAAIAIENGLFSSYFIGRSRNHKDFALILFKEKSKHL